VTYPADALAASALIFVLLLGDAIENHKMKTRCFDHIDLRVKNRQLHRSGLPRAFSHSTHRLDERLRIYLLHVGITACGFRRMESKRCVRLVRADTTDAFFSVGSTVFI
jgi:hypothetical protein